MKRIQVGDLVRYNGIRQLGIVTQVILANNGNEVVSAVRWANGNTSHHPNKWLIKLKTSEDI